MAGLKGSRHIVGVNDFTASTVKNENTLLHLRDILSGDKVARFRREVGVERNVIGDRENIVHRGGALNVVLSGKFIVPIKVKTDDLHAEGAGANGDFFTDAAHADDTDGLIE